MIKFGTGGWRAIIGDDFTKANVQLLTCAVAKKLKDDGIAKNGFVVGFDRRFLSEVAAKWICEVLAAEEIPCEIILEAAPTPLVMYAVEKQNKAGGMAVTASHNPAIYNGIKVFIPGGRDADEVYTADAESYIEKLTMADVKTIDYDEACAKGLVKESKPMNAYIDSIIDAVDLPAIREKGLKVILDPMFGVSKTALQTILMTARCDVEVIHERRDALFGGRLPAPHHNTLNSLTNTVLERNADIGIATDGDADRLGVIDNTGEFLHPNKILVMLYYYLVKYKGWKGAAVRNIATTHLLDKIAAEFGEECYEVPVGFKHVAGKMIETDAIIGGESSGGLTVRGHISGKDGIYAASLLVEMIASTGRTLSEVWKDIEDTYGVFEMTEHDARFTQEKKEEVEKTLMVDKKLPDFGVEIEKVSYMDGCKVYFKNGGWIIGRFSGTEPLIRVFCEMGSLEEANRISNTLTSFLGI